MHLNYNQTILDRFMTFQALRWNYIYGLCQMFRVIRHITTYRNLFWISQDRNFFPNNVETRIRTSRCNRSVVILDTQCLLQNLTNSAARWFSQPNNLLTNDLGTVFLRFFYWYHLLSLFTTCHNDPATTNASVQFSSSIGFFLYNKALWRVTPHNH